MINRALPATFVALAAAASMSGAQDCAWSALGTGLGNTARDFASHDDGSGPALYAGGIQQTAGGVTVRGLARWADNAWSAVGTGFDGDVQVVASLDDGTGPALYAGGFIFVNGGAGGNRVARWDGQSWSTLGQNIGNTVFDLAVFDDGSGPTLYAAGRFRTINGVPIEGVAQWDGAQWQPVGAVGERLGGPFLSMQSLAVYDDGTGPALYAGGQQFFIGGDPRELRVARWDGTAWSPLVPNAAEDIDNSIVYALETYDDGNGERLYIAGSFISQPQRPGRILVTWDGTDFGAVPEDIDNTVFDMTVADDGSGDRLFVSGSLQSIGASPTSFLGAWDGTSWQTFGGANDIVWSVGAHDDGTGPALYASGNFGQIGSEPIDASRIARFRCDAPCPADFNTDGVVNILDVVNFITNWNAQGPGSDFNADGAINILDVVSFITTWNAGCP